jgi:hypothetical protein
VRLGNLPKTRLFWNYRTQLLDSPTVSDLERFYSLLRYRRPARQPVDRPTGSSIVELVLRSAGQVTVFQRSLCTSVRSFRSSGFRTERTRAQMLFNSLSAASEAIWKQDASSAVDEGLLQGTQGHSYAEQWLEHERNPK